MATSPPTSTAPRSVGYDEFVDARIAKTRTAVKTADLATGAVLLLAWTLLLLLVAAVADHWVVKGGLDRWERFALFGVGLAGAGLYVATRLGPTLLRSVNPLYAAREIERESPELKNSLLNLLQLRGGRENVAVKQTLERQAAERLAQAGDAPIDHTPLVRVAKLLLALVAVVGVYVVASPKDFFASAGRVLAPWAEIAAPSRVRITTVEPGSTTLAQGQRLDVSAMVTGLRDGDLVELVYRTADGRVVGRRAPMRPSAGGLHFAATLPAGGGAVAAMGLQGGLSYRIEAGDAHTPTYRVEVLTAPTIAPVSVRYDYPPYTGYPSREVEGVGDLRGPEGTRVTLTAEANLPIESAQIDLAADGRPDVRMQPEGRRATGAFVLRLDGAGADSSTSYVLRFASPDGQANHDPPQYRVEVIADLPPEASITLPEEKTLDVAVNEAVRIAVEARDPDFALRRLRLLGEVSGRLRLDQDLPVRDGRGKVVGEVAVTPAEIGLRPGDVLDYWAEAADNRTPNPGVGRSERRRLRVTGPADPQRGDGAKQDGADGKPAPNGQGDPQAGEDSPQDGPGGAGQNPPNEPKPGDQQQSGADGQQQPGDQQQPAGPTQPRDQKKPQAGKQGEKDESDQPPPNGLTGPGDEGEENQQGEANDGAGATGSGDSEADQSDSGQANPQSGDGSQGGQQEGGEQQQPSGGQPGNPSDGKSNQGAGQGGDPNDAGGDDAPPVARDGSDDGSAFDRIREFLKNQQPPSGGEGGPSGDDQPQGAEEGSESSSEADPSDARGKTGAESDGKPASRDAQDAQSEEGAGGDESGDAQPGSETGQQKPRDGAAGDQPERPQDGPGAGERDRSGQQSDSKSSESGGDSPPGESSDQDSGPRQGTDGAGQGQAADQGAGQSSDRGAGDSSGRPGGEQQADSPTGGESAEQSGEGSRTRDSDKGEPGQSGEQPGNTSKDRPRGDQEGGEGAEGDAQGQPGGREPGERPDRQGEKSLGDRRGEGPQEGGKPGDLGGPMELADRGQSSDAAGAGSESGGDAANLDYARRQTDLVLQQLDEQLRKKELDRRLLDKLGWTEEDVRRFVDRWRSRQQRATDRGAEGEAELDRALRSLGLSPGGPTTARDTPTDSMRDLRDRARTKTPPRLREQLERYNRSVNATGDSERAE